MALFGSSSPFGASNSSPFGASSTSNLFGTNNSSAFGVSQSSSSLFGAKPFGSPTFGAQTGSSMFGGTATGVFGATQGSTSAFGASSTPAFGSTQSAFGSGTSVFGQKPAAPFGSFGATQGQSNPFGGTTFGQSQPAFGSSSFGSTTSAFGSTTFGASTTPAFGASSTPAFGASSTPAFGASSTPAFGASSTPAFGASSSPAFGAASTPAFGASSSSIFGSSTPAFGSTSTPAFGSTAFGANSSPAFGSSTFNAQTFGGQRSGSRAAAYTPTTISETGVNGKLITLSAMPAFTNKSPEELRWEDYQAGDKGGPSPPAAQQQAAPAPAPVGAVFGQAPASTPFGQASTGVSSSAFNQTNASAFNQTSSSAFNQTSSSAFNQTPTSNPFGTTTSSIFGSKPAATFGTPPSTGTALTSSPFGASATGSAFGPATTPSFGLNVSSPFGAAGSAPSFGSSSLFASTSAPASSSAASTTSLFSASTPAFGSNPFSQPAAPSNLFSTPNQAASTSTPSVFSTPTLGSNLFGSSVSPFQSTKPAVSAPGASLFGAPSSTPAQTSAGFGFSGLGQTQSVPSSFATPTTSAIVPASQLNAPPVVNSPFGSLPPMPHISIGNNSNPGPSVQYGISNMPVIEKPTQVRMTSVLTPRHITQRSRIRMQARGYQPRKDVPRASFLTEVEDSPNASKGDALFVPRENPRALFIRQNDNSVSAFRSHQAKGRDHDRSMNGDDNGHNGHMTTTLSSPSFEDPSRGHQDSTPFGRTQTLNPMHSKIESSTPPSKTFSKQNGLHSDAVHRGNGYVSVTGHRAGEAAIAYEHGADIEALMPKLRHMDYYIQPKVQELAAKERAEPGYCRMVNDFLVGRHGYGFIKFLGETDVRGLDIESIIQFNKCEVLVYMDESKKPPPGVGLNKAAEITLLNVKCVDKKTGQHLSEGNEVEKFERRLKKKTEEQGAEFVSYNATRGEWIFRVKHFSRYHFDE